MRRKPADRAGGVIQYHTSEAVGAEQPIMLGSEAPRLSDGVGVDAPETVICQHQALGE